MCGFDRLILATGARDVAMAFPGWDQPGVVGANGLHALLQRYDAFTGRRIVVLGSGELGRRNGAACARSAGLEVAAVVEVLPTAPGVDRRAGAGSKRRACPSWPAIRPGAPRAAATASSAWSLADAAGARDRHRLRHRLPGRLAWRRRSSCSNSAGGRDRPRRPARRPCAGRCKAGRPRLPGVFVAGDGAGPGPAARPRPPNRGARPRARRWAAGRGRAAAPAPTPGPIRPAWFDGPDPRRRSRR